MRNKYNKQNEMESSCKQMLYFDDENKRMCNRFTTYKKHLRNKTTFVVLIYLGFSVLHKPSQFFVEGKQIVLNGFTSERNSQYLTTHPENIESSKKNTKVLTRNLIETPNSDYSENEIQPSREPINIQGNAGDIYNELTISNKNNTEIKDSSDFTTSGTYSNSKNLKLSIKNSVKSEIAINEHLELLVLKSLKNLPEPEIRKTLSADITTSGNTENSTKEIIYSKEDISQSQSLTKANGTNYQFEDTFDHKVLNNNNLSTSLRDSFNDNYQITQNNNKTLRLLTNMPSLEVDFSFKANETDKLETLPEMINTVVANNKSNGKVATSTTPLFRLDSKEFVTHNSVNKNSDDILSVKLHETILIPSKSEHAVIKKELEKQEVFGDLLTTTTYLISTEQSDQSKVLKSSVDDIYLPGEEQLKGRIQFDELQPTSTCIDEIEENVSNTENYQSESEHSLQNNQENELLTTSTEQSNEQNKALKSSVEDIYLPSEKQLKDRIQFDELQPTNTCIDEIEENVSNTENFQSMSEQSLQNSQENELLTTSTEQSHHEKSSVNNIYLLNADVLNERRQFDDELDAEIIPTSTSIEQIEENSFTTEYYQSESEQSYNLFNKTIRKELFNNSIKLNELYNDKNVSAIGGIAIDNYNQLIDVSKIIESNSTLFTNNQNERKIDTIKIDVSHIEGDKENHKHHSNENVLDVAKKSENIINELEQNMVNISTIWIPDVRIHVKATEQYENNNILKSIQIENIKTDLSNTLKDSLQVTPLPFDDIAATLFEGFPPRDVGQTFNDNLADESAGIGKALPVSETGPSNRSTVIIIFSSSTAFLFIAISVTIFLISFQRQHGTLDIEMQERNCGKDDLDEEDAQTFAKLLEVHHSSLVVVALGESEECL